MNGRTVRLVARREILERVRTRAYLASTVALVVAAAVAAAAPHLLRDSQRSYEVGLAGHVDRGTVRALAATGSVHVRRVAPGAVRSSLADGSVQAVLVDGRRLVVRRSVDPELRSLVQTAVVLGRVAAPVPQLTVTRLESAGSVTRNVAFGAAILLYAALIFSGTWVASGIVEEKSGRVLEIVLAAVRPGELLAGKLLGIGLVALGQVAAATAAAAIAGIAAGSLHLPHGIAAGAAGLVGWFTLGYALYACAFAAAASLVSRQEDLPAVTTPLNVVMAAAFLTAMAAAERPDGTAAHVLSLVPPFSPLLMPVRAAAGEVPAWELAASVALALAALAVLARVAATIYAGSALRSGTRLSLRSALLARGGSD